MSERIFDVELKTALEKYLCLIAFRSAVTRATLRRERPLRAAAGSSVPRVAVARLICSPVTSLKDSVCVPFFFFFLPFLAAWTNLLLEMINLLLQRLVELGSEVTSEQCELGLAGFLH